MLVAWISNGCFASGVATKVPTTVNDELIGNFEISLKFSNLLSKTTWIFLKKEPSFTSINPSANRVVSIDSSLSDSVNSIYILLFWNFY